MNYIKKSRVTVNRVLCHYGLHKYTLPWQTHGPHYCAICNSKFKLNDEFYLVINNSVLFQNCGAHASCISIESSIGSKPFMNFKEATEEIYNKYKIYKHLSKLWI